MRGNSGLDWLSAGVLLLGATAPVVLVLLQQLALEGCIVTIDAMGTQTKIARQIIQQEGDYALALKDNQGNLYEEVEATFAMAEKDGFRDLQWESDRRVEKGHGRLGIREYWTIHDPDILSHLDPENKWEGLRGIGMVRSERRIGQQQERETRSFLALVLGGEHLCLCRRSHWGIENSVHWVLDVAFRGKMIHASVKVMLMRI